MLLVTGCHHRKAVETVDESGEVIPTLPDDNTNDGSVNISFNYTGIVRDMSQNDGCGFLIELDAGNGEKLLLEPLSTTYT